MPQDICRFPHSRCQEGADTYQAHETLRMLNIIYVIRNYEYYFQFPNKQVNYVILNMGHCILKSWVYYIHMSSLTFLSKVGY